MITLNSNRPRRPSKAAEIFCCLATVAGLFAALLMTSPPASAASRTGRIVIEYAEPKDPAYKDIADKLRKFRVLEYVKGILDSIRLPRVLTVKLADCGGVSNSWYANDELRVCYEYAAAIYKDAAERDLPSGVTREDTIIGPLLDVFMHESGHAMFDYLDVPIFGREEDAADQFSTYILLQYDKKRARELILGSAYQYRAGVKEPKLAVNVTRFADEHGLAAERFYNVLCMAYGDDPKLFADFVEKKYLPPVRAAGCDGEYRQVQKAFRKLITPYVDKAAAKRAIKPR